MEKRDGKVSGMTDERELRQVLAGALVERAKKDDRITVLEADLMSCHATKIFKQEFPERFVNVGIAEQNMMGIAAGMSTMGKIPFAYSFAPFATRRCYDQIFISIAYASKTSRLSAQTPESRRRTTAARTCRLKIWHLCARYPIWCASSRPTPR